jgi:Fe-S cluster biogenesis protein NfuA
MIIDLDDNQLDYSQRQILLAELVKKIKGLLDEYVRPAVESDGGAISFHSYNEGVVKVQLRGSCSGCPSSTLTLKSGIENLLKNAAEATVGRAPTISLTAREAPDGADILVEDSGRGISPEDLPKVMRAGFTTKPSGHGLGLHSFAVFLSATGGSLRVESAGLDCGTRVIVEVRNA